ncbi:DUF6691 family protein [Methylomicrobium lacus]|uniref:DUF6691 family protein n=1 Tax=Methylomicrobium lacus TaxID=136992 RepID=UPI0035A8BCDE
MKTHLIALLSGILFGAGLALAHMVDPNKVLNFLDVTGHWDPSLLFVMVGALSVAMIAFKLILKRPAPLWSASFHLPPKTSIDLKLIAGAAIFGIGWGMSGYCPGPSVTGLSLFSSESVIMIFTIYLGFFAYDRLLNRP